MNRTILLLSATIISVGGCTSMRISQDLSSGVIGCPARDIAIVNEEATISGTHTWEAHCGKKVYFCSYQETTGVHCTPKAAD
jgi:hypothetical protein